MTIVGAHRRAPDTVANGNDGGYCTECRANGNGGRMQCAPTE